MKKSINKIFYVYEWYDIDTGIPFYVGKGKDNRYLEYKRRNTLFLDYYSTHNCDVRIIYDNLTEDEAFNKESEVTLTYILNGIYLTNQRAGNRGGYTHTDEAKKKISIKSKECWNNKEYRDSLIAKISHPKSDTTNMKIAQSSYSVRLKQRLSHLGKVPYNKGMKMPESYCNIMKIALNKESTKKKMSINNNSNKSLLVVNSNTNEEFEYYNIQDFINNQTYIHNKYKNKRNLWRAIKNNNYRYNEYLFYLKDDYRP